jgi:hypothetical protein
LEMEASHHQCRKVSEWRGQSLGGPGRRHKLSVAGQVPESRMKASGL